MWWTTAAWAGSLVLLGEPSFRAPDGIADAAVLEDGTTWVLSPRGEAAHISRNGEVLHRFQACADRSAQVEMTVSARGDLLGLGCGRTFRLLELPSGAERLAPDVDPTHAALSPDGRRLALLGERFEGDTSEDTSWLLVYDTRTGEVAYTVEGEWDHVVATRHGWAAARGDDEGHDLAVWGFVERPDGVSVWTYTPRDEELKAGGWTPERSLAVRDRGETLCLQHDNGGTCLSTRNGERSRTWRASDQPFRGPGPGAVVRNHTGRAAWTVRRTLLAPVGRTIERWIQPVDVQVGGTRTAVLDLDGRVHVVDARGRRVVGASRGPMALSPDGRFLWTTTSRGGVRMDLEDGSLTPLPPLTTAVFANDGTLWGTRPTPDAPELVSIAPDASTTGAPRPLPRWFDVTGLTLRGDDLLVHHDQDDHWVHVRLTDPAFVAQGAHTYLPEDDLQLVDARVLQTSGAPRGRMLDGHPLQTRDLIRILPDGGWVAVPTDGRTATLQSADGQTMRTLELPERVHEVWVHPGKVVFGLRDGRLAVLDL